MPRTGRGRWYDAVGGIGLEYEYENESLSEMRWLCAGHIETNGKRTKTFAVHINQQEESYISGTFRTMDDAKADLMRHWGVTEIVAPPPFEWMRGRYCALR